MSCQHPDLHTHTLLENQTQTALNHQWNLLNHAAKQKRCLASSQCSGSNDGIKAIRTGRNFINQIVILIII